MKIVKTLFILCCFTPIMLWAAPQEGDKLVYADFETVQDNHPVSSRGGAVNLFSYAERPTMPSKFKGSGSNPSIPDFAVPDKNSPNKAIVFDYELQGTNQYAGVGVEVRGHPWKDGKTDADDVSGYKYMTLQLYATGINAIKVEFGSQ